MVDTLGIMKEVHMFSCRQNFKLALVRSWVSRSYVTVSMPRGDSIMLGTSLPFRMWLA